MEEENGLIKEKNNIELNKIHYSKLIKPIYNFNTIIDFWQFWNIYPGNEPSKIFFDGEKIK